MANTYFQFKQFRINQEGSAMKVGTDGVLLGAWANVNKQHSLLDVGAGSGLISLMLAQRSDYDSEICAVEIDKGAYQQTVDNFCSSPWSQRLEVLCSSIQTFADDKEAVFDHIVSNPPYFVNSQKGGNKERDIARHTDELSFDDLISCAFSLLKDDGKFSLVLPIMEGDDFILKAINKGFFLSRKTSVIPNPGKDAKRYLLEFVKVDCETIIDDLIVENGQRHVYSPQYIELTKDFYLKF